MRITTSGTTHSRPLPITIALLAGLLLLLGRGIKQTAAAQDVNSATEIVGAAMEDDPLTNASTQGQVNPEAQKLAGRTMQVTVVGPDEKPLAGAKIHASIWSKDPVKSNRDYVCDERGRAAIELPKSIDILRLWAGQDGHASLFANWWPEQEAVPREIPREFTFRLEKGTVIGGIVKNEDGEPIMGAKVAVQLVNPNGEKGLDKHPIPNIWLADADTPKTTDAQGRWMLDTAPSGDAFGFLVMLGHPDYVSDYSWGGLQNEQGVGPKPLRERTATIVMHRGTKLSGVVTDGDGKTISDAVIIWGDDPYFEAGSQEVRTDAKGRYQFPPLPAGALKVTVAAKGWMPEQRRVGLAAGESTADFELKPGQRLRLHFMDDAGNPIPGVGVGIRSWRGGKALYNHVHPNVLDTKIPVSADKDGVYEWTWAPEDAVTFSFHKAGYKVEDDVTLTPDSKKEFDITLTKKGEVRQRPRQK
jgi:hypothetical protein